MVVAPVFVGLGLKERELKVLPFPLPTVMALVLAVVAPLATLLRPQLLYDGLSSP